jgi:hypothetical protein
MTKVEPHLQIAVAAGAVYLADQLTKLVMTRWLDYGDQHVVADGFFKFVLW